MVKTKTQRIREKENIFIKFLRENEISVERLLFDLSEYYQIKAKAEENTGIQKTYVLLNEKVNNVLEDLTNIPEKGVRKTLKDKSLLEVTDNENHSNI